MRSAIFALLSFVSMSATAATTTIDFEEFDFDFVFSFETQGFVFSASDQPFATGVQVDTLWIGTGSGPLTMQSLSGDTFSVLSWDLLNAASGPIDVSVTGYLAGGGALNTTFTASELPSTFSFSSAWQGLTAIELSSGGQVAFDNVTVSIVPIPAAVWLFGSALACLGWMGRKQPI